MDPSYNNGNGANAGGQPGGIFSRNESAGNAPGANTPSNVPGANPGVIASGPDPEDAPSTPITIPTSSEESSRSKISSFLGGRRSRTPSGGRVNTPSMVSIAPQPMQLADDSKKPKKALIIGGIALIILLIVGLIVGLVGRANNGGGKSSAEFNELINYVTSGTESTKEITDAYNAANSYYFLTNWDDLEEKAAVYNKTKTLLDKFVASYKDGNNTILNDSVKDIKEEFDFMYAVGLKEEVFDTDLMIMEGVDEIETEEAYNNYLNNYKNNLIAYYNLTSLGSNRYAQDFSELYKAWVESEALIEQPTDTDAEDDDVETVSYTDVFAFLNMDRNFVVNLYSINELLHGNTTSGENNE